MSRSLDRWPIGAALVLATLGGAFVLFLPSPEEVRDRPWEGVPSRLPTTDHAALLEGPFESGSDVTRRCLDCHEDAAHQVMQTPHWTWETDPLPIPGHDGLHALGKKNVINNFCIGVQSNWSACTSCHAGYGWEDDTYSFADDEAVDCLVCHDHSGTYQKGASGYPKPGVDLLTVARSVGGPTRGNCGTCHFRGGGGDAVKHGDLDGSLLLPPSRVDVHMGRHEMICTDCHVTDDHAIAGRTITVGVGTGTAVACTDCHAETPHADDRINLHADAVACQTCHIPLVALREATKTHWDWSQAGDDREENSQTYLKKKGAFEYTRDLVPEYRWFNGTSMRHLLGDRVDPDGLTTLNDPRGDIDDDDARIWPFKVHRGRQLVDAELGHLLVPKTAGEGGYWTDFDWDQALRLGAEATGIAYSGTYDFTDTEMFWPLTHMVGSKDEALGCVDCHSDGGRLDWAALGYPGDPLTWGGREAGVDDLARVDRVLHPALELRDEAGRNVLQSGEPISTRATCGSCHDVDFITATGTHGDETDLVPDGHDVAHADPGGAMNCFVCHLDTPDHAARTRALTGEHPGWAATATLAGTGVVTADGDTWRYTADAFTDDGLVRRDLLHPVDPTSTSCGGCHGTVHLDPSPLALGDDPLAERGRRFRGEVYAAQSISASGLNLVDKADLDRSWDVHAERLVDCVDCHPSANNPAYRQADEDARPDHLRFDARRLGISEYLERPSHALAHGGDDGGMSRDCRGCHDAGAAHDWLPHADRHFAALACEACHVPELHAPALAHVDHTMPDANGSPRLDVRGAETLTPGAHDRVRPWTPVLLPRRGADGETRLAPHNLVTTSRWVHGDEGVEVATSLLDSVLFGNGALRPVWVPLLDRDGDGRVPDRERTLRTSEQVTALTGALARAGVEQPRVASTTEAIPIHHSVTKRGALRTCTACHATASRMSPAFGLGDIPDGTIPTLLTDGRTTIPDGATTADGVYRHTSSSTGLYVLGHDAVRAANGIGLGLVLLVAVGAGVHAVARIVLARWRTGGEMATPVRLYTRYERFWHWLQAVAILLLIATGLEMHLGERVTLLGFSLAVRAHEVVGFLVVANALLAAFYHLASGAIRQYLPEPRGFFAGAERQVRYYVRGIFRGEPHPFERAPGRKLNSLQQVTYLGILNVLLPAQMLTGILMWGVQRWPQLDTVGGLALLAPVHALGAWAFAAFLLMHVYLTTTGPTPAANLRSMLTGWEGPAPKEVR